MRTVKCQDTGELVPSTNAYKASNGKYYSSEEAFKHLLDEKMYRQRCLEELGNILGYHEGQKFPTIVAKKLKEYEYYGYDVVLQTIISKRSDMVYSISHKDFASEYNRVSYIMAIITNSINDIKKKIDKEKRLQHVSNNAITSEEVESSITPVNSGEIHDISKFL
jgi:hypothetical protein